jgi:phosphate transport system permease protein
VLSSKTGNKILIGLLYLCIAFVLIAVLSIIGYVFFLGLGAITFDFLVDQDGLILSTVLVVLIALAISVPIGICSAIYMQMYAKKTKFLSIIRFSIDSLAGVPSIIFGLFAVTFLLFNIGLNRSILAGALSVSLVVLPMLVKSTEEAIKTIPNDQIEASLALGATKFDTIRKIVLPGCLDGILTGVVLSLGRILGETAAILFVIGSLNRFPTSILSPGGTLATQLYLILMEPTMSPRGISDAYALALILIVLVIILNLIIKLLNRHFRKKRGY